MMVACLKVEKKILKGRLDSISSPSPSVKIQIMGGKVCLRGKGKTLLGIVNKLLYSKVCWQHPAMFCLYTFPTHNLNFHWRWRWWDRIQAIFLNIFYFTTYLRHSLEILMLQSWHWSVRWHDEFEREWICQPIWGRVDSNSRCIYHTRTTPRYFPLVLKKSLILD